MKYKPILLTALAGFCAGAVAGLFGAGGGMVLVPLLTLLTYLDEDSIFPASISIMLPICLVCLTAAGLTGTLPFRKALPYLFGSAGGGIIAGIYGRKIPAAWLHRGLGIMILWGGFRYLC